MRRAVRVFALAALVAFAVATAAVTARPAPPGTGPAPTRHAAEGTRTTR
jgi:hypothetical protein